MAGEPSISSSTASANFALTREYCSQSDCVEDRPGVGDVAERPQRAVGEAVVVASLLFLGQPDAAQRVGRLVRRHGEAAVIVGRLVVAAAAAVRDPDAAGRAHDRIERRDEAAGRTNPRDSPPTRPTRLWMYGSRFATTTTRMPLRRSLRSETRRSRDHSVSRLGASEGSHFSIACRNDRASQSRVDTA